jgi:hypothetical protein
VNSWPTSSHVPALADSDRNRSCDLVPAKHHWLDRTADVRYERMESVLVVHVIAVDPKSREYAEQPMCRCCELSTIQPDNRHLSMGTRRLHQRAGCSARRVQASAREHPAA